MPIASRCSTHPLKREIIVTQVVNDLVNGAGMTFWPRLSGETGASASELTNANFVAREIFGSLALRDEIKVIRQHPRRHRADEDAHRDAHPGRAGLPLVGQQPPSTLDSEAVAEHFTIPIQRVMAQLPDPDGRPGARPPSSARRDALVAGRVPEELATKVAVLHPAYMLLGIIETAYREELEPAEVARLHFALGERLGLPSLVGRILELPRADRWQTMARAALRDDLYAVHAQLTAQAMGETSGDDAAEKRIEIWEGDHGVLVQRAAETLVGDLFRRHRRPRADVGRPPGRPRSARGRVIGISGPRLPL